MPDDIFSSILHKGTDRLKVGIVCYPTYGGSGVIATELGYGLSQQGHDVHFICYNQPARLDLREGQITFHMVNVVSYPLFEFPPYTLALSSKIYEVMRDSQLDVVHVHYAIPHSTAAFLAKQMLPDSPAKIITTLHGTDVRLIGIDPSYKHITKFSIEQSDGVTAVSNSLADVTIKEFGLRKPIEVVPNFVDTQVFTRQENEHMRRKYARPYEKIVCHISNFREVKKVPNVIRIFEKISRAVPSKLLLVGNGPDFRNCVDLVTQLRLDHQVFFLDFIKDVPNVLSISDLFLLPSENESFGLAALEALSCEVPVIASRVGGLPEVIVDGECGYLVESNDLDRMAGLAIELLKDDHLRRRMGRAGRNLAELKYGLHDVVRQYARYYEAVINE